MTASVLIPWGSTCPHRLAALDWLLAKLDTLGLPVVLGDGSTDEGFSRTRGLLDAASRTDADVLVCMDGDVWCDPTPAIDNVGTWAIPHRLIHRLSQDSTAKVLQGADWHGLPLSTDNRQDSRPYTGHPAGTLVVLTRGAFDLVPPDPRFVGWGQEDAAWATALRTLVGKPWRGTDDLVHLWHPAEPRRNRVIGNDANAALWRRYQAASGHSDRMRALLDEARVAA